MITKEINMNDCEFILDKNTYKIYITDLHTDLLYFADCTIIYNNKDNTYYAEITNMYYPYDLLKDLGLFVNIESKSGYHIYNIDYLYLYVYNVKKFKRKLIINSLY